VLHSLQGLQLGCSCLHNAWQCLCLSSADSHIVPLHYCYISDAALAQYMFSFENFVTYPNTVFASDRSLAVAFASPLSYFTGMKYTVQSSHSLVLCPQSSTFCVDPSLACDAYSSSSASASSPWSHSYPSTSLVSRSILLCPQSSTFCVDPSSACDAYSTSSASASLPCSHSYPSTSLVARSNLLWPQSSKFCIYPSSACDAASSSSESKSSPSSPSYPSRSLIPTSNLSSSVAGHRQWLGVGMASRPSHSSPSSS